MLGLLFSIAATICGCILCFSGKPEYGFLLFLIGAVWHISFHLSAVYNKLKEIQEGLYAELAVRCGLIPDKKKEVEE